jgi:aryl-alcohol dehydrogenase-like predicted oxidoreductase
MKRIALQNAPFDLPVLGIGCMGMSEFYGPADDDASLAVLSRAVELGVTFFDTADMYGRGHNEQLIGRFLLGRRVNVIVATKCGIVRGDTPAQQSRDTSPSYIRAACEASLKRLSVETIDLYYLHRLDGVTPIEDSMGELARLHAEGKIRAAGLSEVSAVQLRQAHAAFPVAAVQSEYSLATRGGEVEAVIDACADIGAAFVAYSPLSRGLLTGAFRSHEDLKGLDFRFILPRFEEAALAHNLPLVDALAAIAAARNATPAQIALAWVLARAPHICAIPGMRSTMRLEENVTGANIALTPADLAEIALALPADAFQGERYPAFLASKPA